MKKRGILKIIFFSAGLAQIIYYLTTLMSLKNYSFPKSINELISPYILADKADGFYNEQKNSLDVVFVGSNNVHCDITPNIIWNEFGITSYNFSSDSQDLGTSYYYLKQVFETQTPKVVMIDILNNGSEESITALEAHFSFDFMKNDLYKIQAIFNRTKEDRLEILFPLITYHSRRKELNKDDFLYRHNRHNILKGSFIYIWENNFQLNLLKFPRMIRIMNWQKEPFIGSIQELCGKNNCECLFIKKPLPANYNNYFSYFLAFEEYCRENNLPFLFMNRIIDEINLDFEKEFADLSHLNWNGQKKLSFFLGKYLQENYHIENKKGKPGYERFDQDYEKMMYYINNYSELSD